MTHHFDPKQKSHELIKDRRLLVEEIRRLDGGEHRDTGRHEGISIIVPTYLGEKRIASALDSLAAQTISHAQLEIIIVSNGPKDGTADVVRAFCRQNPELDVILLHREEPGAGRARNLGLATATRRYITFLDDDDVLEPRYLEVAYDTMKPGAIVLNPISDITENGKRDDSTALSTRIRALQGKNVKLITAPWVLGFNACKLIPAYLLQRRRYNEFLRSGEDVVFFAQLLEHPDLNIIVPPETDKASYLRTVRKGSVSRPEESFDFSVTQRFECIRALQALNIQGKELAAREALEQAQFGFALRYLEKQPDQVAAVADETLRQRVKKFPWQEVNRGQARRLVFSYCFPPFSDTSATVAAKVVLQHKQVVDVILNDMSGVRETDDSLLNHVNRWIDTRVQIAVPPSFSNWTSISEFGKHAVKAAEALQKGRKQYLTMYSRALWLGSHVAAALYKHSHPQVLWEAEFSDPLRWDAEGRHREGPLTRNDVTATFNAILEEMGWDVSQPQSAFDLVELVTFLTADTLVFTNENQMEFMLHDYPSDIQGIVQAKAVLRPHPLPPAELYEAVTSDYELDPNRVNIGYFGNFYPNRGLGDLFHALEAMDRQERERVAVHIFCNGTDEVSAIVDERCLDDCVFVNSYRPYLEFLNLAKKLEVLLVNDVVAGTDLPLNPFLPSKYSDYKGSGRMIWGMVDEGSPLSRASLDFSSPVGDVEATLEILTKLLSSDRTRHHAKPGI